MSPSCTFSLVKIPPSKDWMTCSLDDGMTLPVPVETSSSLNTHAQIKKITKPMPTIQITRLARGKGGSL